MSYVLAQTADSMSSARRPWFAYLFLLGIFAVASFTPYESVDYVARRDKSVEIRLDESVERTEAGNPIRRVALCLLGAYALVVLLQRNSNRLHLSRPIAASAVFFFVWASCSTLWSYDAALTVRRVAILGLLCACALAAAKRFSFDDLICFVFLAGCVTIGAGLACEAALGTLRPWDAEYRFAGGMNPIFQGAHSGMTIVAALVLAHRTGRARGFYLAIAALALATLLLTHSRGPAAATAVGLVVYGCVRSPKFLRAVLFVAVFMLAVCLFPSVRDGVVSGVEEALLVGRQIDPEYGMQGRDALWEVCLKYAAARPMLGYGYDAFWTRDFTFAVTDASGFTSQHTHNALLDLLLGVGLPGVVAFGLAGLLAAVRLYDHHKRTGNATRAGALALLVLYAIHNQFVSVQLAPQLQTFAVMVIVAKLAFFDDPFPEQQSETEGHHARYHR